MAILTNVVLLSIAPSVADRCSEEHLLAATIIQEGWICYIEHWDTSIWHAAEKQTSFSRLHPSPSRLQASVCRAVSWELRDRTGLGEAVREH